MERRVTELGTRQRAEHMLEAGRGGLGTREAMGQKRELSQSDRKESFQRPLMVRGGKGREQGRDPKVHRRR